MPVNRKRASRNESEAQSGLPLPLRHTGEVDEFDAAVARGAAGARRMSPTVVPAGAATGAGGHAPRRSAPAREPATGVRGATSLIGRAIAFLQASIAELQRVQWPDRRQVFGATAVVLGFCVICGVYLGASDWLAQKVVNFIL